MYFLQQIDCPDAAGGGTCGGAGGGGTCGSFALLNQS